MKREDCKSCKSFFVCELKNFLPFPETGCSDYVSAKKKKYVLVHIYMETGLHSIMAFSDSEDELFNICKSHPSFGSSRHVFCISPNLHDVGLDSVKDSCLLRICESVAFLLSRAKYHMLKHRYTKSKFCFDKTFKQISDACNILENY